MGKVLKIFGIVLGILILLLIGVLYSRYGGGELYPDVSTAPIMSSDQVEEFFAYDEPIGNIAASKDTSYPTRVFITIHPESRPGNYKLVEIVDDKAIPYPNEAFQKQFTTILGLYTDQQSRLWSIDHGNHGFDPVKLLAFDLNTDEVVHEYTFPSKVAEKLSFFNDLCVSPDGKYVFVADVSFFGKKPSIAVYDVEKGISRSLLDGHPSIQEQGYIPNPPTKKMSFFGGLVNLRPGVDGIDVDDRGTYVYYATMSHEGLYRIPVNALINENLSAEELASRVELVSKKPLSDGIKVDQYNNVYITDIEHQGLAVVNTKGELKTLFKDSRIRWADGVSFGSDGFLYIADSAIPDQMLQSKSHMAANAPYYIFRIKPDYEAIAK